MALFVAKRKLIALISVVEAFKFVSMTCLSETNALSEIPIKAIIDRIRSNEFVVSSVLIEGTYERFDYNADGELVYYTTNTTYRFSRSNDLIKVEYEAHCRARIAQHGELVPLDLHNISFYTADSTVDVNLKNRTATIRYVDHPHPFPLSFGYGLDYQVIYFAESPNKAEIRTTSASLEDNLRGGFLRARKDPVNPELILLEAVGPTAKARWRIDPQRGYLIVSREGYAIMPVLPTGELLVDKTEVTPKQYDSHWYIERARQEYCTAVANDSSLKELCPEWRIEIFTATKFVPQASLKPGELQFSTNHFPNLSFLADSVKNQILDLVTGKRMPWGSSSQQPGQ
jgi:hypothetical protein